MSATDLERGLLWEIDHAFNCLDGGQTNTVRRVLARMREMIEEERAEREAILEDTPVLDREP